jgi:hypothetical protein
LIAYNTAPPRITAFMDIELNMFVVYIIYSLSLSTEEVTCLDHFVSNAFMYFGLTNEVVNIVIPPLVRENSTGVASKSIEISTTVA